MAGHNAVELTLRLCTAKGTAGRKFEQRPRPLPQLRGPALELFQDGIGGVIKSLKHRKTPAADIEAIQEAQLKFARQCRLAEQRDGDRRCKAVRSVKFWR